jgi:hypothetical protein
VAFDLPPAPATTVTAAPLAAVLDAPPCASVVPLAEEPEPATTVTAVPLAADVTLDLPPCAVALALDPLAPPTTTVTGLAAVPVATDFPAEALLPPEPASTVIAARVVPAPAFEVLLLLPDPACTVIAAAAVVPAFEVLLLLPDPACTVIAASAVVPAFEELLVDAFVDETFPPDPAATVMAAGNDAAFEATLVAAFVEVAFPFESATTVTGFALAPFADAEAIALVDALLKAEVPFPPLDPSASTVITFAAAVVMVAFAAPATESDAEWIVDEVASATAFRPSDDFPCADTVTAAALVLLPLAEDASRAIDAASALDIAVDACILC